MINEAEARRRREAISQEADFYGAMDGAAKFVRGDAIAGIIITFVNIVGGFAVGMLEKGWTLLRVAGGLHQADHRRRPGEPDPGVHHLRAAPA